MCQCSREGSGTSARHVSSNEMDREAQCSSRRHLAIHAIVGEATSVPWLCRSTPTLGDANQCVAARRSAAANPRRAKAGVRNLQKHIEKICRKIATKAVAARRIARRMLGRPATQGSDPRGLGVVAAARRACRGALRPFDELEREGWGISSPLALGSPSSHPCFRRRPRRLNTQAPCVIVFEARFLDLIRPEDMPPCTAHEPNIALHPCRLRWLAPSAELAALSGAIVRALPHRHRAWAGTAGQPTRLASQSP